MQGMRAGGTFRHPLPVPGRTGAYEPLRQMSFLYAAYLDMPIRKGAEPMNAVNMFCRWMEETFPLTRRGLLAFGIVGAAGFLLGALCGVWCLITIIQNLPVK